jgi:hypothetical protein
MVDTRTHAAPRRRHLGLPVDAAALALIEIEESDEEPRRLA